MDSVTVAVVLRVGWLLLLLLVVGYPLRCIVLAGLPNGQPDQSELWPDNGRQALGW